VLIIRNEQMAAFAATGRERFARRCAAVLRQAWPARLRGWSDAELLSELAFRLDQAGSHGLERDDDLLEYLHLCVLLGHRFPGGPDYGWARSVLADATLSPSARVRALQRRIADQMDAEFA
jgi:hypothetical protein